MGYKTTSLFNQPNKTLVELNYQLNYIPGNEENYQESYEEPDGNYDNKQVDYEKDEGAFIDSSIT